ncbi:glycosyltransferase family 4 protein [Haloferax volcanii]|nr:glycosyltransferase family 4 protein [Haloferax volcanii]
MRIVHLQHPYIPNMGYQENHLPAKQRELGHDVHIITSDVVPDKFDNGNYSFDTGIFEYNGVPVYRNKGYSIEGEAATAIPGAIKKIRDLDPDVIHSHRLVSFLSPISMFSSLGTDAKLFFDLHFDNGNFNLDTKFKRLMYRSFTKFVMPTIENHSDGFIAVNNFSESFLKDNLQVDDSNIHFLPLGSDTDLFYPCEQEREETRERLGVAQDDILLIHSGNINRSKNTKAIIESISGFESITLLILGNIDDEYRAELEEVAGSLDIRSNIIFHEFVEHSQLSRFYNAADIGIWPGKLGITIIEAVACGLPVIIDRSDATKFVVSNGNGFMIDEANVTDIENCLTNYVECGSLLEDHSKNAVQLAKTELSWDVIAEKSIEIYRSG